MTASDDFPQLAELVGLHFWAARALRTIDYLRQDCAAWMNGVADHVEPYGYNRQAACGPADLLPGLKDIQTALEQWRRIANASDAGIDATINRNIVGNMHGIIADSANQPSGNITADIYTILHQRDRARELAARLEEELTAANQRHASACDDLRDARREARGR
jgi:hypothetical protein